MIGAIIAALAPYVVGALAGHHKKDTTPAPSSTQNELEQLALGRVRTANPLYEAVMKMAAGRMPNAYRPGGGLPNGGAMPLGGHSSSVGAPDHAQQIVDAFREQSDGRMPTTLANTAMTGAEVDPTPGGSTGMYSNRYVNMTNPQTGESRPVLFANVGQMSQQGWVVAQRT